MYFEGMEGTRKKRRKSLELVRRLCGGGGRSMGLSEMMQRIEAIKRLSEMMWGLRQLRD